MFALRYKLCCACLIWLCGSPVLASDHEDIDKNKYDITGFFVFRPTKYVVDEASQPSEGTPAKYKTMVTDSESIVMILNVAPHTGFKSSLSIFSVEGKYSIFVDNNGDFIPDFQIDAYFGGSEQYAFYVTGAKDPILGKINETAEFNQIKVFAGRRADPEVFDTEAFVYFLKTLCAPVKGLRCEGQGEPDNTYKTANVGSIAVQLPIRLLNGLRPINQGKLRFWAKVYSEG